MSVRIKLELDLEADAAYIELSDAAVVETKQVNDEVYVDLDEHGVVVGIETLRVTSPLPFVELETRFHVHSDVIAVLRAVRPNPSAFVGFVSKSDSSSTAHMATAAPVCV